jgi:CheY-like chemotaxis protein
MSYCLVAELFFVRNRCWQKYDPGVRRGCINTPETLNKQNRRDHMESNSILEPLWPKGLGHAVEMAAEEAPGQGQKILIVDDDLFMREITGMALNEKGYACTTAMNAVRALDHLKSDRFDLVITGLHLPGMDGMALLKWIKHHFPATKVIMIAGKTDTKSKGQALLQGVDHYLTKPFTLEKIFRQIEGCLEQHHSAPDFYSATPPLRATCY